MDIITLNIKTRELSTKEKKALRKTGRVPAIVYGKEAKNMPISVDAKEFNKVFKEAGESTILELTTDDKKKKNAVVKDFQRDPVRDDFIHIDFLEVSMTEKMTAEVPLKFVGISKAVKDDAGILVKNVSEVEVECLPADLPREIKVSISSLDTFDDVIKIKDIEVPEGVEILEKPTETIVVVTPPRSEEELESLEEEVEEKVEDVEGVTKEEEGEEGEEGEKKEDGSAGSPQDKDALKEDGSAGSPQDGSTSSPQGKKEDSSK
ncbi:MAG: 50S ribosomal protein L25 [bacterium]